MRVGGSAWELKFDTKRVQYKKNKHLEYGSERRNETKRNMAIRSHPNNF